MSSSGYPISQKVWPYATPPSLLDQIAHGGGLVWQPPPVAPPPASLIPQNITGGRLLAVPMAQKQLTSGVGAVPVPGNQDQKAGRYYLPGVGQTYLDPDFADRLGGLLAKTQVDGLSPSFTSAYRDQAQQAAQQGNPAAITPAKLSLHSEGRAVDTNMKALTAAQQAKLIADAGAAGLSWGGNFAEPDRVHFYFDPGGDRQQKIDAFARSVQALKNRPPDD